MTQTTAKPGNIAAVVGLVAAIVSIPPFVFGADLAAWALALTGLIAGIVGVRRAGRGGRGGRGLVASIVGIVVASLVLIVLVALLVLFLTRPLRY